MIEALNISLLDYAELESAAWKILDVLKEAGSLNEAVLLACSLIEDDVFYLQDASRKPAANKYTGLIKKCDRKRDSLFKRTKNYLLLFKDDEDNVRSAAGLLLSLIRNRDWKLHEKSYDQKSALLNQLFADFSSPDAAAAIAVVGADRWIDRLIECQKTFEELIHKRVSGKINNPPALLSTALRRISRHLTTLFRLLEMYEEAEPERYTPVNNRISAINVRFRKTARRRKTLEDKKDSD